MPLLQADNTCAAKLTPSGSGHYLYPKIPQKRLQTQEDTPSKQSLLGFGASSWEFLDFANGGLRTVRERVSVMLVTSGCWGSDRRGSRVSYVGTG